MKRALVVVTRLGWAWNGRVPCEDAVAAREELLRRVTAASLRQVQASFDWVWLVAPERREQVQEIANRVWPSAVLVAEDGDEEAIAPDATAFAVARLDSDDAYMPLALEDLADMDLDPNTIVNWTCGWQLDWAHGWLAERGWALRTQGGFLAVTSEGRERIPEMLLTGGPHTKAREGRRLITVLDRSWVRVNHGANTSTKNWPGLPCLPDAHRDEILSMAGIDWRTA